MATSSTDFHLYRLPLKTPFRNAWQMVSEREGLLLVHRHSWGVSLGDAAPLDGFSVDTLDEVLDRAADIHPLLASLGSAGGMEEQRRRILDAGLPPTLEFAASAIAIDMACKAGMKQVAMLLDAPMVRDVRLNGVIGLASDAASTRDSHDAVLNAVAAGWSSGLTEFKIKSGPDIDGLLALLRRLHEQFPALGWKIDFNGSLSLNAYRDFCRALAPGLASRIRYVEDPTPCPSLDALAEVREIGRLPLAIEASAGLRSMGPGSMDAVSAGPGLPGFESASLPLETVIQRRLADVVVVKPMAFGAIHRWPELHFLAQRHQIPIVVSSLLESGVGRAHSAQIARIFGDPGHSHGLHTGPLFSADLVPDDWIIDGSIHVAPGVGWVHSAFAEVRTEANPLLRRIDPIEASHPSIRANRSTP